MTNLKIVYKIIGQLLFMEALMMALCAGLSLYCAEDDVLAFVVTIAVTIAASYILRYLGREADNSMGRRDA